MFKHQAMIATFETGVERTGPRPTPTPAPRPELAAARSRIDQEHTREAGADGHLDRQSFVNDRLDQEGLAGPARAQRQQQLEQEFNAYDQDHNNDLSASEFASMVENHVQSGQGFDMGARGAAGDLSQAESQALNTGITERGEQVSTRQANLNQWLQSPQGQEFAHSDAGRQALGPTGQLTVDGKEGPRTRAVMTAMAQAQARAQAQPQAQPAGGAAPANPQGTVNAEVEASLTRAANDAWQSSKYEDIRQALTHASSPADFNAIAEVAGRVESTQPYAQAIRAMGAAPTPSVRAALRNAFSNAGDAENVTNNLQAAMNNPNASPQDLAAVRAVVANLHEHGHTSLTPDAVRTGT